MAEEETEHIETPPPAEMPPAETGDAGGASSPAAEAPKSEPMKPRGPRIPLPSSLQEIVGALLFASESPLTAAELRACVRGVAPEEGEDAEVMSVYQSCTSREVEEALHGLEKELERSGCGFRLVCAGGAYRLQTAPACGRYVRALLKLDRPNRLSRASLETLAIIAYRQPITKAEIEQIRGVAVDTIVKSLVDLQLVRLVGRSELPGHPFLYGTSPLFLEHFGLASLSELNALDPTLQRSNPRERAKLFVKEKKPDEQPTLEDAAKEADAAQAAATAATDTAVKTDTAVAEEPDSDAEAAVSADEADDGETPAPAAVAAGDDDEPPRRRVSFRPDDDEEDDEPLIDDDEGNDASLVDDDDEGDDESLVDDDEGEDDESLLDDDDEGDGDEEFDDDDEEADDEEAEEGEDDDDDNK